MQLGECSSMGEYTYKPYQDHWVIYTPDGLFYCSCDSYREVQEELEQIEKGKRK